MFITFNIPNDLIYYYIFIHNKDQMYLPKLDQLFGSYYVPLMIPQEYIGKGLCLDKQYQLRRTHWRTLDRERLRCDAEKTEANTTGCITNFLEKEIGCSMGLQGADHKIKR